MIYAVVKCPTDLGGCIKYNGIRRSFKFDKRYMNLLSLNIILEFYNHVVTFAVRKNIKGNKCLQYSS